MDEQHRECKFREERSAVVTIQQLDNKYSFDRTKVATASKKSYYTVVNFFKGASTTVSTAAAIINVLPITALERAELIATMFQPDGRKGREG